MAAPSQFYGKLETDIEIKASPQQFHDMFSNKPHHVHHATYDKIQGCQLHDGDWGKVGSIVCWNYFLGKAANQSSMFLDGKPRVAKDKIEAVDLDNNLITYRVIEGDLMEEYLSFVIHIQASPNPKGEGSIVHWTLEYERKHDAVPHPETVLQFCNAISKDIDAHLTK